MSLCPESPQAAAEMIHSARGDKKAVIPAGRLSRLSRWAKIPEAEDKVISTKELKRIISVEPENLLAIVEAGLTPAEVRQALVPANLYWPVSGQDGRSLGAIMAEGAVSLETMGRGPMIDWVLGVTFIEPSGRIITSGGRTLKNVSGYDLTRFQWKAWGTLGLSAVFVLKCLPLPEASQVVEIEFSGGRPAAEAAEKIIRARLFPQGLHLILKNGRWSLLAWFSGFEEFVEAQICAVSEEAEISEVKIYNDALAFWSKHQENWPLEMEGCGNWLGSRAELLKLADGFNGLGEASILEADIDLGGGQARLCFSPDDSSSKTAQLNFSGLKPQAPALEGEVYQRLKRGLDPEDLFFPSSRF